MLRERVALGLLLTTVGVVVLSLAAAAPANASAAAGPKTITCSSGLSLAVSGTEGPAPFFVQFSLTVYWGSPFWANWSFGDGNYLNDTGTAELHPGHTFSTVGAFESTVAVSGDQRSGACSVQIRTTPPALVAHAQSSPDAGVAPLVVHLTGSVLGGTGTFVEVSWSFGDGNSAPGFNLTYAYSTPGTYHATFNVVDSAGDAANATVNITVQSLLPPPSGSGVNLGEVSVAGILAATIAAFVGAVMYVRSHPYTFSSSEDEGEGDGDSEEGSAIRTLSPIADAEYSTSTGGPGETTALATTGSRFPAESYRGVFLDLSAREYDVLAASMVSSEVTSIVPTGQAPIARPMLPKQPRLSHRVVLHLFSQPRLGDDEVATVEFTQTGMMESLVVPQSLLSNVLRRLTFSGYLVQDVRHVQGVNRRLNVYRLTPKGERFAERLRKATPKGPSDREKGTSPPAS
jgi:PKD repeat protein